MLILKAVRRRPEMQVDGLRLRDTHGRWVSDGQASPTCRGCRSRLQARHVGADDVAAAPQRTAVFRVNQSNRRPRDDAVPHTIGRSRMLAMPRLTGSAAPFIAALASPTVRSRPAPSRPGPARLPAGGTAGGQGGGTGRAAERAPPIGPTSLFRVSAIRSPLPAPRYSSIPSFALTSALTACGLAFAARRLHHLTDEPAGHRRLRPCLLDLLGVRGDDRIRRPPRWPPCPSPAGARAPRRARADRRGPSTSPRTGPWCDLAGDRPVGDQLHQPPRASWRRSGSPRSDSPSFFSRPNSSLTTQFAACLASRPLATFSKKSAEARSATSTPAS